ncbi:MAG: hypothetical protein JSR66_33230 [Proteobacteria bacterium]|nr:hypothetical protein [Pseudomonadota bacterium]
MSNNPSEFQISEDSPILKLEQLHDRLRTVFEKLSLVRDTAITCTTTAENLRWGGTDELAKVIHHHIMLDVDKQMQKVTECIELLGFTTDYSAPMHDSGGQTDDDADEDDDDECDCCCHRRCDCDDDD